MTTHVSLGGASGGDGDDCPPARAGSGLRLRASLATGAAIVVLLGPGGATARAGALLPERGGSPNADRIASLYTVVLVVAALVFAGVAASLVYALLRYRASRNPVPAQIRGNTRLEFAWTMAAAGLVVALAVFSYTKLDAIEHPDRAAASPAAGIAGVGDGGDGALHIDVVGRQFVWMYKYPNGAYSYEEMVAPVGVTVELDIVSLDVAHSWWVPKLGGKFDALPGYVNHTWFRLEQAGVYTGQCAELCGRNHAQMVASVRGVAPAAYARWVARQKRVIDAENATAARERRPARAP
jgi:cytochrome c oxidase subunit 2